MEELIVSDVGGRSHPAAAQLWYAPRWMRLAPLTGGSSSSSSEPRRAPGSSLRSPPPSLHAASRSLQPVRPDEAESGRADEDEQDMPDAFCHLFGILYSGHLLFPKYVPTR